MYIQSKLVEVDKKVCGLRLPDEYNASIPVQQLNYVDKDGGHVDVDARILHTSGLCIKKTFLSVFKKVTEHFYTEGEHIRYFFFIKGTSRVYGGAGNQTYDHEIGVIHRNFLSGPVGGGRAEIRSGNEIRHVVIIMSRDFFAHLVGNEYWAVNDPFVQHVLNGLPEDRPDEAFPISLRVLGILHELLHADHITTNRRYYVELKLRELFFVIHEQQLLSPNLLASNPQLYKTLERVKAYLVMNFTHPPTIKKLARLFLLNEKKLMQDFKTVYGITIYAFIIQLRMEKARNMLLENYNVNDMAAALKYRSVSHFIKMFKSYYGYTPKEALMHISKMTTPVKKVPVPGKDFNDSAG